jgi:hypothetical protein
MNDERFFILARLHGFQPDRALREFADCVAAESHLIAKAHAMRDVLQRVADFWAGGDVPMDLDRDMRALLNEF